MRVTIAGGGIVGSYLANLLSDEHEVIVLERQKPESFKAVCAWGTSYHEMRRLLEAVDLEFDEYVLHVGKRMAVDLGHGVVEVPLKGLCTFDKRRLILDLHKRIRVLYGAEVRRTDRPDGDLVVDATGFHRTLLPRPERDYFIPSLEYLVKYRDPPLDDFYVRPLKPLSGYLWYFPLGDGLAHVGAGDYYKRHVQVLNEFVSRHEGEVLATVGRPVRITPPHLAMPVRDDKVVGVGESVGAVYPVLGEGIIPGMQNAEILTELLSDSRLGEYEEALRSFFMPYYRAFQFIRKKFRREYRTIPDVWLLISIFIHMKLREKRYGMKIRMRDWLKVVRTYG
ncbi:MAG: NAD(P)/FAD-dependent oxidoreductase [Thaumarchaeota archaeon]|nr:NAD(P)/FAD-dependent oxidoreductase [Candidatus Calditenuaceae archaeon]MCX8202917.1 NAD(P)/FAD-dependent oxidoreductase [Nitrososphaeria archaeon]MDW8043596.1 NAD(P)/FAD-dependent oxidoreductase [Nitrososphaerota archaeon]